MKRGTAISHGAGAKKSSAGLANDCLETSALSRHKPVKRLFATLHNLLPPVEGKAFTNGAYKKPGFPFRQLQFVFALLTVGLACLV
jgi:hypothetical protein